MVLITVHVDKAAKKRKETPGALARFKDEISRDFVRVQQRGRSQRL